MKVLTNSDIPVPSDLGDQVLIVSEVLAGEKADTNFADPLIAIWASLAGINPDTIPYNACDPLLYCALAWAGVDYSSIPPGIDPIVYCLEIVASHEVDTDKYDTVLLLLDWMRDHPVDRPYWFTQADGNLYINYPASAPDFRITTGNLIYNGNDNLTRQGDYVFLQR
jgi:hypothetical protein